MGENSPEPLGDYFAGPNHVLPTMGTARFSSALSVDTFIKKSSIISYSEKGLKEDAPDVIKIAGLEGLDAHLMSIKKRITP
jgi:histidinol dehydrogenase